MHRILVLLACLLASLAAVDLRPYAGPEAPLYAQRREHILAQWRALTVGSFAANGVHGAWDADLARLLEHVAASESGAPSPLPRDEAAALAKRLAAPPACADPLAAWCAFMLAQGRNERWSAGQRALRAFDQDAADRPAAPRHPRLLEALVAAEQLDAYGRQPKDADLPRAAELARRLADAIGAAIRGNECAGFPAVLIGRVKQIDLNHQDFGEPVRQAIDDAVAAAAPPAWVGDALKGTIRIANAWAWRGSGWASSVTPEGWQGFERNLAEADALLTASWRANPADPLAAAYACTLAGAGNSATPLEVWMERSAKACFDHSTAFQTALNFSKPRWGGSYDRMLALGCDGVDTERFDTSVPWRIVDAIRAAIADAGQMKTQDDLRAALNQPRAIVAVERCLAGYQRVEPARAARYACVRAAIHWHAGREKLARAALARLAPADLDPGVARDFGVDLAALAADPASAPDF